MTFVKASANRKTVKMQGEEKSCPIELFCSGREESDVCRMKEMMGWYWMMVAIANVKGLIPRYSQVSLHPDIMTSI